MTPLHLHHTVPPEEFEDWLEAVDFRMSLHKAAAGGYEGRARTVSSVALLVANTTNDFEPLIKQLACVAPKSTYSRMRLYAYGLLSAIAATNEDNLLPAIQLWDKHVPPCRNHLSVLPDVVSNIVVRFPLSPAVAHTLAHSTGTMEQLIPTALEERAMGVLQGLVSDKVSPLHALSMLLWDIGQGPKTHPNEFHALIATAIAKSKLSLDTCWDALSNPANLPNDPPDWQLDTHSLGSLCEKIVACQGVPQGKRVGWMAVPAVPAQVERLCTFFSGSYAHRHHLLVSTLSTMLGDRAPTLQRWAMRHPLEQATETAEQSSHCAKRKVL